jgi:hypothetical protein
MKKLTALAALAALAVIAVIVGCSNPSGGEPLGSANAITGFTVAGAVSTDINAETKTVTVTVPLGTALTDLAPTITIDGTAISPASLIQQDFFTTAGYSPVVYTVTAADGSKAYWTATVKWAPLEADADIGTYLSDLPENANGGVSGGPVILPVSLDLSGNGWADLLDAIDDANSVSGVALDLSACTGGGAVFDPDYTVSTGKDKIVSLILPDAATSIKAADNSSNATFRYFTNLKSVTGENVETVGEYAFSQCSALETVSLPAATTIGELIFYYNCTSLKTANLPAATTIGRGAFWRCTALTTVNLPKVQTIGDSAFSICTALTSINLPASLTNIERNPFPRCPNLTAITVAAANPSYKVEGGKLLSKDGKTLIGWPTATGNVNLPGINTVGAEAFFMCTGLTSITLTNAADIGDNAFAYCDALTTVTLPKAITIGGMAFYYCDALETVTLPVAQTIDGWAFISCDALETVALPAAVTIGAEVFCECAALKTVNLPKAVTIGEKAFWYCKALETVSLPKVMSIGEYAFGSAETTADLTVTLGDTPPELRTSMFYGVTGGTKTVTVKVPASASGYAASLPATYSSAENTDGPHWGEGFRGKGWTSGGAYESGGEVNENISLTIEVQAAS